MHHEKFGFITEIRDRFDIRKSKDGVQHMNSRQDDHFNQ